MRSEPSSKRVIAFIDGQNLFHAAKTAFGYTYPNYDAVALVNAIISRRCDWALVQTRFYTGVPDFVDSPFWKQFWNAKLAAMGRRKVWTYSRSLRYRIETIALPDGTKQSKRVGQEKGIDVRMALDIVRLAREGSFDIGLILSQDQDLSEAATEVRSISAGQSRWIKLVCAFPESPTYQNRRGINGTDWIPFDKQLYDTCIDTFDYRP